MGETAIPYLTKAANYVVGCDPVSDGCKLCWARRVATTRQRRLYGTDFSQVRVFPERLTEMLSWRQPQRVGLSMMGDLFHEHLADTDIESAFAYAALCQQHDVLVFTKRAERAYRWFARDFRPATREECVAAAAAHYGKVIWDARGSHPRNYWGVPGISKERVANRRPWPGWPLPNVIPIVSVCNQRDADEQLPWLVKIPAARRGVSIEPILGPVDLTRLDLGTKQTQGHGPRRIVWDALSGWEHQYAPSRSSDIPNASLSNDHPRLSWVIVGCESGPGRRPMDLDWVRKIRDQCVAAGVSFYLKQMEIGGRVVVHPELDGRQWMEFPERAA